MLGEVGGVVGAAVVVVIVVVVVVGVVVVAVVVVVGSVVVGAVVVLLERVTNMYGIGVGGSVTPAEKNKVL